MYNEPYNKIKDDVTVGINKQGERVDILRLADDTAIITKMVMIYKTSYKQ